MTTASPRDPAPAAADTTYAGVVELANMIAHRAPSSATVIANCLRRIDDHNPAINAVVHVARERATADAAESDRRVAAGAARPLEGVPIAIKDDTEVAGMPTSQGTAMVASSVPTVDAHLVARLRRAGAIVVGKTNLPEFKALAVTESRRWGVCRNPWDLGRTPGGSSGGSAAAVAAGMVPAAHGSDAGGSLRIPASCCGLFTIKPSRGRVSEAPYTGESPLTSHGFLTRSVIDNAVLLDIVQGNLAGEPFCAPPPPRPYADEVRDAASTRGLRIGWTVTPPFDVPVHHACVRAVRDVASACASLGHVVEEVSPDWHDDDTADDFMRLWSALIGAFAESFIAAGGDIAEAEPHIRVLVEEGGRLSATAYCNAASRLRRTIRRMITTWDACDVVLTPTLAQPPLAAGPHFANPADPLAAMYETFRFNPFTPLVNVSGQPAAQLPLSSHEGLPVGVQAIGRYGDEATLLRLSAQLERSCPWTDRMPAPAPAHASTGT